ENLMLRREATSTEHATTIRLSADSFPRIRYVSRREPTSILTSTTIRFGIATQRVSCGIAIRNISSASGNVGPAARLGLSSGGKGDIICTASLSAWQSIWNARRRTLQRQRHSTVRRIQEPAFLLRLVPSS